MGGEEANVCVLQNKDKEKRGVLPEEVGRERYLAAVTSECAHGFMSSGYVANGYSAGCVDMLSLGSNVSFCGCAMAVRMFADVFCEQGYRGA